MASSNSTKTASGGPSPDIAPPQGHSGAARDGLFFQLFEVSPVPAVVTRVRDHTVLAVNARTSEIFDIPQNEAVGLSVTDYYADPSEQAPLAERIQRDGRADNVRLRIKRRKGDPFWVIASFRLTAYEMVPLPVPSGADVTNSQSALLVAVQAQVPVAFTAKLADAASFGRSMLPGCSVRVQPCGVRPCCVRVWVCVAMVSVAVRASCAAFTAAA